MITPELQNFFERSKASGMSDSELRQTLASQGWSDGDLAQVFINPEATKVHSVHSFLPLKVLAGLIVGLIVIAGVVAFLLMKNKPADLSSNVVQTNSVMVQVPFHCPDLLTEDEFDAVMRDDIKLFQVDETNNASTGDLKCEYSPRNLTNTPVKTLSFSVKYQDTDFGTMKKGFEFDKGSRAGSKTIPDVGSDAYQTAQGSFVLSMNEKYTISVAAGYANSAAVAKLVNANLNKY